MGTNTMDVEAAEVESGIAVPTDGSAFDEVEAMIAQPLLEASEEAGFAEDMLGTDVHVPVLRSGNSARLSIHSHHGVFSESGKTIPSDMLENIVTSRIAISNNTGDICKDQKTGATRVDDEQINAAETAMKRKSAEGSFGVGVTTAAATSPEITREEQVPGAFACSSSILELGESDNSMQSTRQEDSETAIDYVDLNPQATPGEAHARATPSQDAGRHEYQAMATAFEVDEAQTEEDIRRRILSEAVEADIVNQAEDEESRRRRIKALWKMGYIIVILLVIAIAIAAVLIVVLLSKGDEDDEAGDIMVTEIPKVFLTIPTLDLVRKRGVVRCGVSGTLPGLSYPNAETGVMEGMNADHCRAISMAVFGNPDNVEFVVTISKDRFVKLLDGTIDVMAITTTHTMGRDVFEYDSKAGFSFTVPFFYTGLVFSGLPDHVACADALDSLYGNCRATKACVIEGTTHEDLLKHFLPGAVVVPAKSTDDMVADFINGKCHILASEVPRTPEVRFRNEGYTGAFQHGLNIFSNEPLALTTRKEDTEWSNLVGLVVNLFYFAEAKNISKSNASDVVSLLAPGGDQTDTKDEEMMSMMEAILAEFGHYGDLYEKNLEHIIPRGNVNRLYQRDGSQQQQSTGLLYNFPFGAIGIPGEEPLPGLTLETVLLRGYLRCGIPDTSFQDDAFVKVENKTWSGFDVEFCRALAAAVFTGDPNAVVFQKLPSSDATAFLDTHDVDVIAGARVTLQKDYHGYSFSSPYYYDGETMDARALMTLDADSQWSDFAYWIVMAMVYAEEHNIDHDTASEMPIVTLFGERLKQMFGDCILGVGSYGDVYNRTLSSTIPRSGANLLNNGPSFGPQQYAVPLV